jgi:hypothetical protein
MQFSISSAVKSGKSLSIEALTVSIFMVDATNLFLPRLVQFIIFCHSVILRSQGNISLITALGRAIAQAVTSR